MDRTWRYKDIDADAIARLQRELGIHGVTARCLVDRGLHDPTRAGAFLKPRLADLRRPDGPDGIAGFDAAIDRLIAALAARETIGVFGDYDVDGVTTTALLSEYLEALGGRTIARVARRDAGYGYGEADAARFADEGCTLVITCDCGTSDLPAIELGRARGVDTIVLDHHRVPDRAEHPAFALLNPHRPDSRYPFKGLASVGLGFMLAATLRTRLRGQGWFASRPEPQPLELLDLVALGTIADMAPLTEENRVLVVKGLELMAERRRPGLAALLERSEIERGRPLGEIDVSFRLAPRLNAPGRLGDAAPALELLRARELVDAAAFADECERANHARRELTERVAVEALADAEAQAGEAAIVVGRAGWHPGVVGIVAAKLVERFGRPAAVVAIDPAKGEGRASVRSAGGADVYRALSACAPLLVRFGGHAQAAGFTVAESQLDAVRAGFAAAVASELAGGAGGAGRGLDVDALIGLDEVDERLAREMQSMAPFGPGNLAPVIATQRARVRDTRRVGGDGAHLKLTLEGASRSHSAIAFRFGDRDPGAGSTIDVAFQPEVSHFRGAQRVELKVHDLRLVP